LKDVRQWKRWGGWKAHLYDGEIPLCPLPNGNVRRGLVLAAGSIPSVLVTLTGDAVSIHGVPYGPVCTVCLRMFNAARKPA
jgi:hypothetical protein